LSPYIYVFSYVRRYAGLTLLKNASVHYKKKMLSDTHEVNTDGPIFDVQYPVRPNTIYDGIPIPLSIVEMILLDPVDVALR